MGVGRCVDTHFLFTHMCNASYGGFIDLDEGIKLQSIINSRFNCNMRIIQSFTKMI